MLLLIYFIFEITIDLRKLKNLLLSNLYSTFPTYVTTINFSLYVTKITFFLAVLLSYFKFP